MFMFDIETGIEYNYMDSDKFDEIGDWLPVGDGIQYSFEHLCKFTLQLWLI